jgi:hypothetical protein
MAGKDASPLAKPHTAEHPLRRAAVFQYGPAQQNIAEFRQMAADDSQSSIIPGSTSQEQVPSYQLARWTGEVLHCEQAAIGPGVSVNCDNRQSSARTLRYTAQRGSTTAECRFALTR